MRRVVRVFWGPRPESIEALVGRWQQALEGLAGLIPNGTATWSQVHPDGPATAIAPDGDALRGALMAAQREDDWSDLIGTGLRLTGTGAAGWETEVSGLAGGAPEFLLQSLVLGLRAPDEVAVAEDELLALLARVWQPDFGDVTDDDLLDALEDDAGYPVGEPVIGRSGYLSPTRAALIPHGLAGAHSDLPGGAALLRLADPGDSAAVVRAYQLLRDAGALAPLPRPLDRSVL